MKVVLLFLFVVFLLSVRWVDRPLVSRRPTLLVLCLLLATSLLSHRFA